MCVVGASCRGAPMECGKGYYVGAYLGRALLDPPLQRPTAAAAAAAAPGADDGDGGGEGGGAVTLKLLVKRGGKEDRSKELQVGKVAHSQSNMHVFLANWLLRGWAAGGLRVGICVALLEVQCSFGLRRCP